MALLDSEEIDERLEGLDGWEREGDAIVKTFKGADFMASVELVNRIAPVAEEMGHHPDLAISWDTLVVTITSHSKGGLTPDDFELAKRLEELG